MTTQESTASPWIPWVFIGAAGVLLLGSPIVFHVLNLAFGLTNQPAWFLACPPLALLLSMIGFLRLFGGNNRVHWSVLASVGLTVVLSILGLGLLLVIGCMLAFHGAPGYYLL